MNNSFQIAKKVFLILVGIVMASASFFFCYYTLRLLYLHLTMPSDDPHRQMGMYIGAVVFPIAMIVFGGISWLCFRTLRRSK